MIFGDLAETGEPQNVPRWLDVSAAFSAPPPPLDFVLPGLKSGTVGSVVAAGATGKTLLALQLATLVSGGIDTLGLAGQEWRPTGGRVLYLSAEDPADVLATRLHAIGAALDDTARAAVHANLFVAPLIGCGADLGSSHWQQWIMRVATGARLAIFDTMRRFHTKDENDGGAMAGVLAVLERLCLQAGTTVLFLHHTNKTGALNGSEEQQASRGSSVLTDNVRWQANMAVMTVQQAKSACIRDDERKRYVRLSFPKINYAAPIADRWFQRGAGGVLRPVELDIAPSAAPAAAVRRGAGQQRTPRVYGRTNSAI